MYCKTHKFNMYWNKLMHKAMISPILQCYFLFSLDQFHKKKKIHIISHSTKISNL
ncbi:hypothetical protein Hanom_Chr03g00181701 [Helianthus anomalus]